LISIVGQFRWLIWALYYRTTSNRERAIAAVKRLNFFLFSFPQVTALLDAAEQDTDAMAWCACLAARLKLPPSLDSPLPAFTLS